jgi:Pyrimidine dimer DNA glycosylase
VQTFLPYPDFRASAAVLDTPRLGKQRVETYQILRALTWPTYAWKNHPAVRMWRGFVPALVVYGFAVCDAWEAAGRADATRSALLDFSGGVVPDWQELYDAGQLPPWLGHDDVHRSHQAALVRKDPERYRPYFPDVPDDLPYTWPDTVFPRWPVRAGRDHPLEIDEAAAVLGLDSPTDEQAAIVAKLTTGCDAELAGADAALTGVLAGLCLPGRTLWTVDGPHLDPPGPPPPPAPVIGRIAPRSAKEPGPAELVAMAAESAPPEFAFFRPSQNRTNLVEEVGAGLVVVDEASWRPRIPARSVPVLSIAAATEGG